MITKHYQAEKRGFQPSLNKIVTNNVYIIYILRRIGKPTEIKHHQEWKNVMS